MAKKKIDAGKEYIPASPEVIAGFGTATLKKWGQKVISGPDIRDVNLYVISTGSTKLDYILGRPFVEGSINEIYGENGTGKTTMALEVSASATMLGKPVYYFDLERKLTEAQINMVPRLKRELFWRIRPDNGEEAVDMVEDCVRQVPGCVIIFDSITQMLPEVEEAESATKQTMGNIAKLCAKMVRKIVGPTERNRCMVLFISHITANLNPYASGDTTKGGKAVPDIASQRVRLKRLSAGLLKDKDTGDIYGQMTKCKVMKNNQAIPFREVEVPIIYGRGIDRALDLLQICRDIGIIDYSNGWYMIIDEENPEGKRFREKDVLDRIKNDTPYRKSLINSVKELLAPEEA